MLDALRKFLESKAGFAVAGIVLVIALGAVVVAVQNTFGESEAEAFSNKRPFICTETGKTFNYELVVGDTIPVLSPHSAKKTGYPAEKCFWTKDGKPKPDPTLVLLNNYKGSKDPTFCPDCGRLVVGHNPAPSEGRSAPPTKAEYKPRRGPSQDR